MLRSQEKERLKSKMSVSFSSWLNHYVALFILMTLHCLCAQEWTDYNLQWNESEYGGVKDLRITPNKLWKPDILMYNR